LFKSEYKELLEETEKVNTLTKRDKIYLISFKAICRWSPSM